MVWIETIPLISHTDEASAQVATCEWSRLNFSHWTPLTYYSLHNKFRSMCHLLCSLIQLKTKTFPSLIWRWTNIVSSFFLEQPFLWLTTLGWRDIWIPAQTSAIQFVNGISIYKCYLKQGKESVPITRPQCQSFPLLSCGCLLLFFTTDYYFCAMVVR
jgi:hypothetical protein